LENKQAAQTLSAERQQPGNLYAGWRVFEAKCASCHGSDATGSAQGPDLLPRLRTMGVKQFTSLVLLRYDWGQANQARSLGPAHDEQVEAATSGRAPKLTMPAWQGEPSVNAHIVDVHAYLTARADGRQAPGRPAH
jgi:mono/diheme cytochrome c family protein